MRRSCASVDLRNYKTLTPWVWDCIQRHYDRFDFRDVLFEYGISPDTYAEVLGSHDASKLYKAVEPIAKEAARRIANRDLELKPVRIKKADGSLHRQGSTHRQGRTDAADI